MTYTLPHTQVPRDPRTFKDPPLKGAAKPVTRTLRCARMACEANYDIEHIAPERVRAFADAHGFVERLTKEGKPALFCSARCAELHRVAPDTAAEVVQPPITPPPVVKPLRDVPTYIVDEGGHQMRWVACTYETCGNRFDVAVAASLGDVARAAQGHGYVQTMHGTFCSASCARAAKSDADHGIFHPRQFTAEVIAESKEPKGDDDEPLTLQHVHEAEKHLASAPIPSLADAQVHEVLPPNDPRVAANRRQRAKSAKLAGDIAGRRPLYPPETPPAGSGNPQGGTT